MLHEKRKVVDRVIKMITTLEEGKFCTEQLTEFAHCTALVVVESEKQHEDAALKRKQPICHTRGESKIYGRSLIKAIITMEEYTRYRVLRWRLCYRLKQKRSGISESVLSAC
ncbi:hypothetical protein CEXT_717481 [Caerostris extrusa]|uniref:Uncharacterized protein n=1 Tax=Caerostris extrusa TaxID=172846 RepID=A0AAV4XDI8_CAEEX|nr:hypothetical protein CEXT_717481 [Caerostris extrusa]